MLGVKNGAAAVRKLLEKEAKAPLLSGKQIKMIEMMAAGKTKKAIAATLPMNIHTVDLNLRKIRKALDCHNCRGVVAKAIELGLIRNG